MKYKIDYKLLIAIFIMTLIGLSMVYSASCVVAKYRYDDSTYFLKRQLIFAIIGLAFMILTINIDIVKIYKLTPIIYLVSFLLLILVLIPGIGMVKGGARSWIGFGAISIQPSELSKLTCILEVSRFIEKNKNKINKLYIFLEIMLFILLNFGLIMLQPDFGTGLVLVLSCLALMFISGMKIKYFVFIIILGVIGIVFLIISAPYRLERITSFINPWKDPLGSGFQSIQSLFAIAPSGLFGLGFNKSMQKHFFLPEPQNDFIFAIICEEFGLFGAILVLLIFLYIIIRSIKISLGQDNYYLKILSFGLISIIFVQVFINIGVVIGLLPVTGITLPIISYGGSSLVLTLINLGLILNISKYRSIKYD